MDLREVTAEQLIAVLLEQEVVTEQQLVSILGPARHNATLPELERRMVERGAISDTRLLTIKSMLSGYQALPEEAKLVKAFPEEVARAAGALAVDTASRAVAFVEPIPENLRLVRNALGDGLDFDIWVCTINQFKEMLRTLYRGETHERRPTLGSLADILDECVKRKASDIHLKVGAPPMLRIDGKLVSTNYRALDATWMETALRSVFEDRFDELGDRYDLDMAYQFGPARFRLNAGKDDSGFTLAARLLSSRVPTMDDLNLPTAVRRFADLERGLVLVTGPTGSGKSTLLASILDHVARNQQRHIITLEDPIEYVLTAGPNAIVNQRELGESFHGFATGLRQALRQDPDVILVGEMRDAETVRTAVEAAETGHLVCGTMHTYSAPSTIARLLSFYPEGEQATAREKVAYILKGVVSQTLLPRANQTGRIAAMEIMVGTPAIANNLRSPNGMSQMRSSLQTGRRDGMQTMEMSLADLVRRNLVSEEEAEFRAQEVEEFRRYLGHPDLDDLGL